jgi:hypothetical protein
MRKLNQFIQDQNTWKAIFNSPQITFPLSQADVDDLGKAIDSKLSPENLHQDGERDYKEAIRIGNYLNDVLDELNAYCKKNALQEPTVWEAW